MKRYLALTAICGFAAACSGGPTGADGGTATTGGSTGGSSTGGSTSTGGTTGGTSAGSSTGGITVTLNPVGLHPAAAAALTAAGLTPPSYVGYTLLVQGVSLGSSGPSLKRLASTVITSANENGPIVFNNVDTTGVSLGLISAFVSPAVLDAGTAIAVDWPACATGADGGITTTEADGGAFVDSYVPAGAQLYFGSNPPANVTGPAYLVPASYLAMLDCAGGQPPGTLLTAGVALAYASTAVAGGGTAIPGITFNSSSGNELYYRAGYSTATATGPTSANGVATITAVSSLGTLTASDSAGDTFSHKEIATPGNSAYMVFFSPGN
ncbi:MAG: hypothetical protein ACYCWW_14240 [Deltaproteobacteria bacterium]